MVGRYRRRMPTASVRHPHLANRCRPAGCASTCTATRCGAATARRRPTSWSEAVVESGIDVLCITDHNAINGAVELAERLPCRVVVGEELRTHAGEIIGLFLTERMPDRHRACARPRGAIREQGGVVYVPHPFDPMRRNLAEPALVELAARRAGRRHRGAQRQDVARHLNHRAAEFADEHDLAAGAGSDAHVPDALGAAYVEMPDFDGPAEFLASLRPGRVVGHHWDEARPVDAAHRPVAPARPADAELTSAADADLPRHRPRHRPGPAGVPADLVERPPAARAVAVRLGRLRRRLGVEKAFDVALHLGTLVAVVAYFRKDLASYVRDGLPARSTASGRPRRRAGWRGCCVLSTVPAAAVGACSRRDRRAARHDP